MAAQENPQVWAYAAFAFSLFLFLAVFIPSLYSGALFGVIASMVLIVGGLLVAYRMGKRGFVSEPTPISPRKEAGDEKVTLDPAHIDFDDENWRRIHGGPGDDSPPRP